MKGFYMAFTILFICLVVLALVYSYYPSHVIVKENIDYPIPDANSTGYANTSYSQE